MSDTTDTDVRVVIFATASCPRCKKRMEIKRELTEEAIITGNTTQMARYHAQEMRALVNCQKVARGWTVEMCGACRDVESP